MPTVSESRPSIGSIVGARYRLLAVIGEGGAGEVFSAEHIVTGRQVAVKMLSARLCKRPRAIERFRREARAASRAETDGVVEILDFVEHEGVYFLVMELLRGVSLDRWLESDDPPSPQNSVSLCVQVARILEVVHARGVVHRDLKPHNLFIVPRSDGIDRVKLLDFGIAKLREEDFGALTETGEFVGTLAYMAPEQADAKNVDLRADIYSLGVILYQMLTGQLPFSGAPVKLFHSILHEPPPPLGELPLSPGQRSALQEIVIRALAKDPALRFPDMAAFAVALEGVFADRKIESPFTTRKNHVRSRRHQFTPRMMAVFGLSVLAATAYTSLATDQQLPEEGSSYSAPELPLSAILAPPELPPIASTANSVMVDADEAASLMGSTSSSSADDQFDTQLQAIIRAARLRLANREIGIIIRIPAGSDRPSHCTITGAVGRTLEGRALAREICQTMTIDRAPADRTFRRTIALN